MLIKLHRLEVDDTASEFINLVFESRNYHVQEITPEINSDPADGLTAAASIPTNAPVITAGRNFLEATLLETIW